MITKEQYFMLIKLYNKLKKGFFVKKEVLKRLEFCQIIGIKQTNYNTYKQITNYLKNVNCLNFTYSIQNQKCLKIDLKKLDKIIRNTEYFKLTETFIHKSTHGLAETGV